MGLASARSGLWSFGWFEPSALQHKNEPGVAIFSLIQFQVSILSNFTGILPLRYHPHTFFAFNTIGISFVTTPWLSIYHRQIAAKPATLTATLPVRAARWLVRRMMTQARAPQGTAGSSPGILLFLAVVSAVIEYVWHRPSHRLGHTATFRGPHWQWSGQRNPQPRCSVCSRGEYCFIMAPMHWCISCVFDPFYPAVTYIVASHTWAKRVKRVRPVRSIAQLVECRTSDILLPVIQRARVRDASALDILEPPDGDAVCGRDSGRSQLKLMSRRTMSGHVRPLSLLNSADYTEYPDRNVVVRVCATSSTSCRLWTRQSFHSKV